MRAMRIYIAIALVLALLVPVLASAKGGEGEFASDRVLVKFKAGTSNVEKQKVHTKHGGRVIDEIAEIGVQVVQIPKGRVHEKVKGYKEEKVVEYVEPDYIVRLAGFPNDTGFSQQWGLHNTGTIEGSIPDADIDAPEAWTVTAGRPDIKIAIVDTGIDQGHEDLADNITDNINFTTDEGYDDLFGHGTHVAGIAAAVTNNATGVAGTAYECSLMNVKVLDQQGSGFVSWVASGIIWAANNGAKVINLSLGTSQPSVALKVAVDYAWAHGAVVVAAAGNDGSRKRVFPAFYKDCIAVAASTPADAKADFSTYGGWVDIAAPGVQIYSTLPHDSSLITDYFQTYEYGYLDGTSMATAFVSGVAGLVWASEYGTDNIAVRARIEDTADQVGEIWTTYRIPRVNAYNAVSP
ncbi:MAG: S8 family serine peptidase [Bacillota bacterium]